jgi:hypothetical protein
MYGVVASDFVVLDSLVLGVVLLIYPGKVAFDVRFWLGRHPLIHLLVRLS